MMFFLGTLRALVVQALTVRVHAVEQDAIGAAAVRLGEE